MLNKIERISKEIVDKKGRSLNSIEYSLYLTIELKDLCNLYFDYIIVTEIRNKIVKHILERVERQEQEIPKEFFEKLLFEFSKSNGRKRISLGTTIKNLNEHLNNKQRVEFVEQQLFSESVLDRKRAYSSINESCINDVEEKLWEVWGIYTDNNCIALLAEIGSISLLSHNFLAIWHADGIKFYVKNNILKRVSAQSFNTVKFLKDESPISYLSACVAANKSIDDAFALSVAKGASKINELGYVIWCLGKLGKETILYKILDELNSIEEALPIEMWEPEFYGLD